MVLLVARDDAPARPRLRLVGGLDDLSDEDLMLRHRGGDRAAFAVLVERWRLPIGTFLHRLCRDRARTDELVSEVFLKVHLAAARYEPTARFRTWIFTIAWRTAANLAERRRNQPDVPLGGTTELEAIPSTGAGDSEQRLLSNERMRRVDDELMALSERHRAAFLLYYGEELSCAEVAEALGAEPEEIKGRIAYARKLLRARLVDLLDPPVPVSRGG